MKKSFLALALSLLVSTSALAGVFVNVTFVSEPVNTITKVTIATLQDGKMQVTIDPSRCSKRDNGEWNCTRPAIRTYTVDPRVISDSRPVDGPLTLDLDRNLHLEVGSGYNLEGVVTYTAIFKGTNGNADERLPLKAIVGGVTVL